MNETIETFGTPDTFCEGLARIERIGSCRRLVFYVTERDGKAAVAKLVVPAEIMADLAQMIAADLTEPGAVFARLPVDAVKH
jgi:hypothetical protein